MPQNKRESLIYTVMMCFFMVLWMSVYNVSVMNGGISMESIREGWLGLPIAYIVAMCCDWFMVSRIAKGFAFRFLLKSESSSRKKVIVISCCMVVPMVILMSFYGAIEACTRMGSWENLFIVWLTNIPKNIIMALPVQLLLAGPIIRKIFRKAFPVGTVVA
jgi:hypothetical protein